MSLWQERTGDVNRLLDIRQCSPGMVVYYSIVHASYYGMLMISYAGAKCIVQVNSFIGGVRQGGKGLAAVIKPFSVVKLCNL